MTKKNEKIHKTAHEDAKIIEDLGNVEPEETLILKNKITNLEKEITTLNEKLALSKAELINYRKRKDEEVAKLLKYASSDILEHIIVSLDNFQRAIKAAPKNEEYKSFLKGFELTYQSLLNSLEEEGIKQIECLNKEFDENVAEAIALDNNPNILNNYVTEVFQNGYMYKDRLLRAAKVKVNNIEGE